MSIPMPLAAVAVLAALVGACGGSSQAAARPPVATAAPAPSAPSAVTATTPAPGPPVRVADCAATTEPRVPTPRAAADLPGAPVTAVAIVGTVCSAATGEPLAGVRVEVQLQKQLCAQGHQPWRCAASALTDGQGHYGLTVFDVDAYQVTVLHDGYHSTGGIVRAAQAGVVTANWTIAPIG